MSETSSFQQIVLLLAIAATPNKGKTTTEAVVVERTLSLFGGKGAKPAAVAAVRSAIVDFQARGFIAAKRAPKAKIDSFEIQPAGLGAIESAVGPLGSKRDWQRLKNAFAIPLALGVGPPNAPSLATFEKLRIHLLLRAFEIPYRTTYTSATAMNLIVGKYLKLSRVSESTVREQLLHEPIANPSGGEPSVVDPSTSTEPIVTPEQKFVPASSSLTDLSIEEFAIRVRGVAHHTTDGRLGEDRVFISALLPALGVELGTIANRLLEANRRGLLHLVRADLVGDLPRSDIERSELRGPHGDVYHFMLIENSNA